MTSLYRSIPAVLLLLASCSHGGLRQELESLQASLSKSGYTDTALARTLADFRPLVIDADDPEIDSLYNGMVGTIVDTARYGRRDLWLYSAAMRGDVPLTGTIDLGLAHDLRYWGNYSAARSMYGRVAIATGMSNPNAVANLGMEYERVGLLHLALKYIALADSVFALQSDTRGRLWMQRLYYNIFSKNGDRARAQYALTIYRTLHNQIARIAPWQMADTVTDVNLLHSILAAPHWREDLEIAYGDSASHYLDLYRSITRSASGRWQNAIYDRDGVVGPLPKPVYRVIPADGSRMLTMDSLVMSRDGVLAYSTRFGTYVQRGVKWFLTESVSKEPHANDVRPGSVQKLDTLYQSKGAMQSVVPIDHDTLIVFTQDSIRIISGSGVCVRSQQAQFKQIGPVLEASALGDQHILVVCTGGIVLLDRVNLRMISKRIIGDGDAGELPISFGTAGASIVPLSHSTALIKRIGTAGYICCTVDGTTSQLRPMVVTESSTCTNRSRVMFHEGHSVKAVWWHYHGEDTVCVSPSENITEIASGSRGDDMPMTRVRTTGKYLALQQYDNIDVIDVRTMRVYPQFSLPIPIELSSKDIVGVYQDKSGLIRGYYSTGREIISFPLSQRSYLLRPSLYILTHQRDAHHALRCQRLNDSSTVVAGNTYTVTTSSNLVTSAFPLQHLLTSAQANSWQVPDVNQFWCATFTPTFEDASINVTSALLDHEYRISIAHPIVSRPWFMPTMSGIIVGLFGITAYNVIRIRRRRQREAIEAAKSQQLELLREDMHDMIGSRLVRIASLTRQASPENTEDVLSRIHDMTLVTVRSLRNLLTLMSETAMTDADFYGSIREYVMESCRDAGLTASVDITINPPDQTTLDNAGRHELLMIVSEMMTNTVRHANATKVRLRVAVTGNSTTLQWSDDGVGLDPESKRGNGLNNIQRRAGRIAANVEVESAKDVGTRYTITFTATKESPI